MADNFKLIAITPEIDTKSEIDCLIRILDSGFDYIHIRKPMYNQIEFEKYLLRIPEKYYPKLKVNDYFHFAEKYRLAGIHLNSRNPRPPLGYSGKVSRSCHSLNELDTISEYEYVFLSPIFNSISKSGYKSGFTKTDLESARAKGILSEKIVALGGINADNLQSVINYGFGGAAFLGYLFGSTDINQLNNRLNNIIKTIK